MEQSIIINRMRLWDVEAVFNIGQECGLSNWSLESYKAELQRSDSVQMVARLNNDVIGFIVMRLIKISMEAEIYNLAVKKSYRKNGAGSILLQTALVSSQSQEIWLEVRESNHTAINFYQKNGFTIVGKRFSFYTNPTENALIMKYKNTPEKSS
jgi:ribosomal-protein-alanine N-acetyltransferase